MRRRTVLFGAGTATVTALAGCIGSAQPSGDTAGRTITVSMSGQADAPPDLAIVRASIEATGDSASEVRDELSQRSDQLYDALVAYGLDEEAITTGGFNIYSRVDRRQVEAEGVEPGSEEESTFYEGNYEYTIEVEAVDTVGEVVDVAVDAGADRIGYIEFTLSDERRAEVREEALGEALTAARDEAEFVAGEVDASVVDVKTVDTTGGRVSAVREGVAETASDSAAGTELRPDDVTVTTTVTVTYEIG